MNAGKSHIQCVLLVGSIRETGLKPVDSGSLEIKKNEKDFLLIRREHMGMVLEV